jgi:undecaprenyl diphosphate synthase
MEKTPSHDHIQKLQGHAMPQHLAIVMDGNGRWAKLKGKPRHFGHVKGTKVAKEIITECSKMGLGHLTLYAFSNENWLRPSFEVSFLMALLKKYLKKETQNLVKENIRFSVLGDLNRLPIDVQNQIAHSMKATSQCTGLKLAFALSYGSRQEIVLAAKRIAEKISEGTLKSEDIDEALFESHLGTSGTPDPDLLIRTSGEKRISNFLLWQIAYSEFYFSDILWPDFTIPALHAAILDYSSRDRRFGKVKSVETKSNDLMENKIENTAN